MIILILIALFGVMVFTLRSGNRARGLAVEEEVPVKKALYNGESGCMGLLFALAGMAAVLAVIGAAFPGK